MVKHIKHKRLTKVLTLMLFFILTGLISATGQQIEEGLVAYFTFDEGEDQVVNDSSGMGNDADVKGDVDWVEGKYDKGVKFDGKSSYAEVSAGKIEPFEAVTMTAWVKIEKMPTTHSYNIVGTTRGAGSGLYLELYTANLAAWQCFPNNTNASIAYPANFSEWHHLAGIYNGKDILIYIDGEQKAKGAGAALPDLGTFPFRISGDHSEIDTWGGSLNGVLDEVRLYGRALNPDEIKGTMLQLGVDVTPAGSLPVTWSKVKSE